MFNALVLEYLKKVGQKPDWKIIRDTGIALSQVRIANSKLQSFKAVFSCNLIKFEGSVAIKGGLCRISGYIQLLA